jgi:AraC-like DNA-binding protein
MSNKFKQYERTINGIYLLFMVSSLCMGSAFLIYTRTTLSATMIHSSIPLWIIVLVVFLIIPIYLHFKTPENPAIKYILSLCGIMIILSVNYILLDVSDDGFMNYFWSILFAALYFNKAVFIFNFTATIVSYLLFVWFFPEHIPNTVTLRNAYVAEHLFYLAIINGGCLLVIHFVYRMKLGWLFDKKSSTRFTDRGIGEDRDVDIDLKANNNKPSIQIDEVIAYLNEYYRNSYNREELAKKFFMNKFYMGQVFKQKTGDTISDYINKLRIEESKKLLAETNGKVIDIAYHVGFENLTHFHRLFKKMTSTTPARFRESVKSIPTD